MKRHLLTALLFFIQVIFLTKVYAEEKPIIAVLDFIHSEITIDEAIVYSDLLSQNLLESDKCYVIGRTERNKLLQNVKTTNRLNNPANYKEAGEKLLAEFIIHGKIIRNKNSFTINYILYDVIYKNLILSETREYLSKNDLVLNFRIISQDLLTQIIQNKHNISIQDRVIESLSPIPIKEGILIFIPKDVLSNNEARLKDFLDNLLFHLHSSQRFIPYMTETEYLEKGLDNAFACEMTKGRNCQYAIFLEKENSDFKLKALNQNKNLITEIALDPEEIQNNETEINQLINELILSIPAPSQLQIKEELQKKYQIETKLSELLFDEKIFQKQFNLLFYQKLLKPTMLYSYSPNLSILSFESDALWYYGRVWGAGAGLGYSYNYPATINSNLSTLPYIHQFELKLIPLSFRSGGKINFILNVLGTLNCHNAYRIINHVDKPISYSDEQWTLFSKIGVNASISYNFNEELAFYWSGLFLHIALPLSPQIDYSNLEGGDDRRPFSIDIGGIGVLIRF